MNNMKIIDDIKLHRKLRIKQEVLCNDVVMWSQTSGYKLNEFGKYEVIPGYVRKQCPELDDFRKVNIYIKQVEKRLPYMYFLLSDIFGGSASLRRKCKIAIREQNKYGINQE